MSQIHEFYSSNSAPSTFYGNNLSYLSDCNLAITVAQNYLKIPEKFFFANFKLPFWIFQNKLNFHS